MLELAIEAEDEDTFNEAVAELAELEQQLEKLEFRRMFSGEHDACDCYVDLQAGSGGTEAQDWTEMLLRMYLRWAESKGFKTELMEVSDGDVAGLKSATIKVSGEYAFGWLRTETGIHRLVRKSPFDSNNRRHVVQCQNDRSQHKNKDQAMKQLKAKLYELELQKKNADKQAMEDNKSDIGWGSQIRSYVLDDSRIKDLRTGVENRNTQAVLDGDLDRFIEASLKAGL